MATTTAHRRLLRSVFTAVVVVEVVAVDLVHRRGGREVARGSARDRAHAAGAPRLVAGTQILDDPHRRRAAGDGAAERRSLRRGRRRGGRPAGGSPRPASDADAEAAALQAAAAAGRAGRADWREPAQDSREDRRGAARRRDALDPEGRARREERGGGEGGGGGGRFEEAPQGCLIFSSRPRALLVHTR
eukprot:6026640-Prymnesium_polylepis.2